MFSGVGAVFAYLAWRQKNADIKEKYFERRFSLYSDVNKAVSIGLLANEKWEWWIPMLDAKERSQFLFGEDARLCIAKLHDLLVVYHDKANDSDLEVRKTAGEVRKTIGEESAALRSLMGKYLSVH